MKNKILKVLFVLFCLSSVSSMSGLDFFQAMISLLIIFDFIQVRFFSVQKDPSLKNPPQKKKLLAPFYSLQGIGYLYIGLFVVILLGWFFNAQPGFDWFDGLRKMKWIYNWYLTTALFMLFPLSPKNLKWVSVVMVLIGVYCSLTFFLGYDVFRGPEWSSIHMHRTSEVVGASVRAGGFFTQPMTFAQTMLPLVMWLCGLMLVFGRNYWANNRHDFLKNTDLTKILLYLIVAVVFASLGVLFSFTRGVWLASAFGLVAMLYLLNKRWMLISIGIGAVVIAGLFVGSPQFKERLSTAVDVNHRHHDERKLVWKTNLEMFKDYPLLGIGWRDNTRRLDEYYDRLQISQDTIKSHAHNQYIQFLSTTGILGIGFYLAIWWWLFKLAYQNWQRLKMSSQSNHSGVTQADQIQILWMKGLSLGALGAFIAFQIASLSETNFDDAKANYMLSFVIASVFWVQQHLDQYVSLDSIDS